MRGPYIFFSKSTFTCLNTTIFQSKYYFFFMSDSQKTILHSMKICSWLVYKPDYRMYRPSVVQLLIIKYCICMAYCKRCRYTIYVLPKTNVISVMIPSWNSTPMVCILYNHNNVNRPNLCNDSIERRRSFMMFGRSNSTAQFNLIMLIVSIISYYTGLTSLYARFRHWITFTRSRSRQTAISRMINFQKKQI